MSTEIKEFKVSVVIPVYNAEPYLEECLQSLCHQTLKEIEIICVDDGSTDGSLDFLRGYQKKDSRIQVLQQKEESAGAALARNMGLRHAKGEYLYFLDADDYVHLELLEKTYTRAKKTQADIVRFDAICFDHESRAEITGGYVTEPEFLKMGEVFAPEETENFSIVSSGSVPWRQLYLRSFVEEHHLHFQAVAISDDDFFAFTSMTLAKRVSILPEKLVYHRLNNEGSQTANLDRGLMTTIKVYGALKVWLEEKGLFEQLEGQYLKKSSYSLFYYFFGFSQFETVQTLFQLLHSGVLKELGFHRILESDLSTSHKKLIEYILKYDSAESFFFEQFKEHKSDMLALMFDVPFPQALVKPEEKVLLYGAGELGKGFFHKNLKGHFCNIVAWVDKNHEKIGFPVTGLETLKNTEFESLLIAVESETVATAIKKELISLGVEAEKIKWALQSI